MTTYTFVDDATQGYTLRLRGFIHTNKIGMVETAHVFQLTELKPIAVKSQQTNSTPPAVYERSRVPKQNLERPICLLASRTAFCALQRYPEGSVL